MEIQQREQPEDLLSPVPSSLALGGYEVDNETLDVQSRPHSAIQRGYDAKMIAEKGLSGC